MIYLAEDDESLQKILKIYLEKEGFSVRSFSDGASAMKAIPEHPDIWILDIGLPEIDGFTLLREIKKDYKNSIVLFISARDRDIDRLMGLEIGAEDYITKPFLPRELVIRVKNLIERNISKDEKPSEINVDFKARKVFCLGKEVAVTSKELDLLDYLMKNKNQALSREQLLNAVWGEDYFGSDRSVDDLVRRLRKKLPLLPLETLYGYGYRLN